jgi:hypothetical protein
LENRKKFIDRELHDRRVSALMKINKELAQEIERLNRVVSVLTGPIKDRSDEEVLLWKQQRTRTLEKIYIAVAEAGDVEIN